MRYRQNSGLLKLNILSVKEEINVKCAEESITEIYSRSLKHSVLNIAQCLQRT